MDHSTKEEKVDNFEDESQMDLCIICCSEVKVNNNPRKDSLLESNLNVIFLLRNLLQVPDSQLEENLMEFGNPVNWQISLCEQCGQLSRQAEQLHWKFLKIREQLRSMQQLSLNKASSSSLSAYRTRRTQVGSCKRREIWRKTNALIFSDRSSTLINPFIEGDKLANYLLSQRILTKHQMVKVELDQIDENNEDQEWEELPEPEVDELKDDPGNLKKISGSKRKRRQKFKYEEINGKFKCPSCDKVFKNPKTVYSHERQKHMADVPKPCKVCGKKYSSSITLEQHIKYVHQKQLKRSCHLCSRRYPDNYHLNIHLLSRHKEDPQTLKLLQMGYQLFRCQVQGCHVVYSTQTSLDKHLENKHSSNNYQPIKPKRFPCQFCSRVSTTKENLKRHQLMVHDDIATEKPFKCEICGLVTSSSERLSVHLRRIHKIVTNEDKQREKKISGGKGTDKRIKKVCHLCGYAFYSVTSLKNHMVSKHREDSVAKQLIEKGYKIWRCKVPGCGVKYTTKLKLDNHVDKVHEGNVDQDKLEKSYFCAFCGKGFFVEESLKRHERFIHGNGEINDGEKSFKCEFCGFETAFQSYLDGHVQRVHRPGKDGEVKGDKVVICMICGLQFYDKDKLEKHKIIHDKEAKQPHACDLCGRAYSTHESMWKHKRKVHKIYRRPEDSRIRK